MRNSVLHGSGGKTNKHRENRQRYRIKDRKKISNRDKQIQRKQTGRETDGSTDRQRNIHTERKRERERYRERGRER